MRLRQTYECREKACTRTLFVEELWTCADCDGGFCEPHIEDLLDYHDELAGETERGSIYLCPACLRGRMKIGPQIAAAAAAEAKEAVA